MYCRKRRLLVESILLKTLRLCFECFRTNGWPLEIIENFYFVLSLVEHSQGFQHYRNRVGDYTRLKGGQ